jgi:hypothetical protein
MHILVTPKSDNGDMSGATFNNFQIFDWNPICFYQNIFTDAVV